MKDIGQLQYAITNESYYKRQFAEYGQEKNILFISPHLSGKQLYKSILPYLFMYSNEVFTAITGLGKYDPKAQLIDLDIPLGKDEILWADYVVIPFTTHPLTIGENNLYDAIKNLNPETKIVFSIDFNFYELSELHPYKPIFTPEAIAAIEDNIWECDICMTSNLAMRDYLIQKMGELHHGRKKDMPTSATITTMPFIIDTKIVLRNVEEFDPQKTIKVSSVEHNSEMQERIDDIEQTHNDLKNQGGTKKQTEARKKRGSTKQTGAKKQTSANKKAGAKKHTGTKKTATRKKTTTSKSNINGGTKSTGNGSTRGKSTESNK